jgi:CubicO group peptidase (beta-lactamase class C family)
MRDLPRDSLVALFSAQPFDFAPGEAMIYNNSGYFLLGLVIEKASGTSYERFIEDELFTQAGMADSRYCSEREIVARRARGYEFADSVSGLRRAAFLVHTWPYAAGSLCSTLGDLVAWNRALHGSGAGGRLLSPASYRELITPGALNDGTPLRYSKGLFVLQLRGRRVISHGGGIFGFLSESRYYPDHDLIIVVLINTAGPESPSSIADAIEETVLGRPAPTTVRRYTGDLTTLTGTYRGPGRGRELTVTVSEDTSGLTLRIGDGPRRRLEWVDELTFAESGGIAQYRFVRGDGGTRELRVDGGGGYYILKRSDGTVAR